MLPLQKYFGHHKHDEDVCIQVLFDRTRTIHDRSVAAESLYTGQTPTASAALLRFILDDTQEAALREEAASTLGAIYRVVGIDHQELEKMPDHYRDEVLSNAHQNGA